ncbi:hypothetical protein OM076_14200 [Solirubrobacter ginsenosidimutans]|uniref:Uncharacterized protein n=1 Tax=Solirubrobacter ginsenosidimutans TaxID=490573 RepID=A0A9X3MS04_9ACTN|nr:hypothetical protein [Solirubrobacter ginsenosidimutans]MDA0161425.1 hypothetical protein [Solirubrobacter ginsenosidimutans]
MRRALLVAALVLSAPGTAAASPFGELPPRAIHDDPACLRATGAPGELVNLTSTGDPSQVRLSSFGPHGLTRSATLPAKTLQRCVAADAKPDGAGIVALTAVEYAPGGQPSIDAILREPGGTWGAAQIALDASSVRTIAAAVSDRGDALVAAVRESREQRVSVDVARRAPGGAFAGAETLFSTPALSSNVRLQAGMSATGEAVVAWSLRPKPGATRELWAAVAPPGQAFHAATRIGEIRGPAPFALAVGPGGHALLVFAAAKRIQVAERAPGGEFGLAAPVAEADDVAVELPTAAVRADGGAVVAWHGISDGVTVAVVRPGPGAFGAPVTLAPRAVSGQAREFYGLLFRPSPDDELPYADDIDDEGRFPRAVILADGRALLTWAGPGTRDGVSFIAPWSAMVPLAGGPTEARIHGSELRDARAVTPLVLENGGAAVAWTRADDERQIHVAVEGAADVPGPSAPRVRIGPIKAPIDLDEGVTVPVACSAACDVRVQLGDGGPLDFPALASLSRAGSTKVAVRALGDVFVPRRSTIAMHVRYGAPGALRGEGRTRTLRVRLGSGPPVAKIVGAKARRDGADVVVTWRTRADAKRGNFYAYLVERPGEPALLARIAQGGPRRFAVRFKHRPTGTSVVILTGDEARGIIRRNRVAVR